MPNETPQSLLAQLENADRRGKNRLPTAIPDPIGIARKYRARIRDMVEAYAAAEQELLIPVIESALTERVDSVRMDSWVDRLQAALTALWERTTGARARAQEQAREIGREVGEHNQKGFKRQIKSTLGVDISLSEPWIDDELAAWSAANATLVSSVAEQAHANVARISMEGVRQGRSIRDIQGDLKKQYGLSNNRAQLIARTETAKLNSELSERRQREIGIETYYWATSRDERVRDSHRVMNGKLCRWDDPTVYSDDGGKTWKKRSSIVGVEEHPGRSYNCRCTSRANTAEVLDKL